MICHWINKSNIVKLSSEFNLSDIFLLNKIGYSFQFNNSSLPIDYVHTYKIIFFEYCSEDSKHIFTLIGFFVMWYETTHNNCLIFKSILKFIYLGKLINCILTYPLVKKDILISDVQIFYPLALLTNYRLKALFIDISYIDNIIT